MQKLYLVRVEDTSGHFIQYIGTHTLTPEKAKGLALDLNQFFASQQLQFCAKAVESITGKEVK